MLCSINNISIIEKSSSSDNIDLKIRDDLEKERENLQIKL